MRCHSNLIIIALLGILALGNLTQAQGVPAAKAKAAAALLLLDRDARVCPLDCDCDGCCGRQTCDCLAVKDAKARASLLLNVSEQKRDHGDCTDDIAGAMKRAAAEHRPIFLWVGMTCTDAPEIRKEFPTAIHCHCETMNGSATPRLLVGYVPSPTGLYRTFPKVEFTPATPVKIRESLMVPAPMPPQASFSPVAAPRMSASC